MRLNISLTLKPAICFSLSCASVYSVCGQQPSVYQSQETLRTNTRLVIVDVVATDSHGQSVTDLTPDDFTMLEEGKPQRISHFSFQHPGEPQATPRPALPPNVVSNAPLVQANVLNVILLDSVNGDFSSQAYAIDQLSRFFASARLDQPVALFALENRIKLLHDFTSDGAILKAALQAYKPPAQAAHTESLESRASAFPTRGDYHTDDRNIRTTLNQLNTLAKTLAGYPGRKNLIWLTESFPLDLFPEQIVPSGIMGPDLKSAEASDGGPSTFEIVRDQHASTDYSALVKKLADSMMAAQVAVYPVDAAGVGRNDHLASQHTANDLATRTGGKAFHNTNDLGAAIQSGLNDGSTYYTLEYYPDNKKWDGQFRMIHVKTSRLGVSLRYRLGYYALDPEKESKEQADLITEEFSRSLQVDAPAATAVRFQAGVVPPSNGTRNKLVVNFAVDPHTVHFDRSDDGTEHARISCTVWAYGANKEKPIMSKGNTASADLKPDIYAQMMNDYFPCRQELELKPGNYTLRLGVLDRTSNLMGTTSASVTVQ